MLVSKNAKIWVTPNANAKICVTPNANHQHEQVEYRSSWVPNTKFSRWPCTFLFFVSISFPLGPVFQWNMGYKEIVGLCKPGFTIRLVMNSEVGVLTHLYTLIVHVFVIYKNGSNGYVFVSVLGVMFL